MTDAFSDTDVNRKINKGIPTAWYGCILATRFVGHPKTALIAVATGLAGQSAPYRFG